MSSAKPSWSQQVADDFGMNVDWWFAFWDFHLWWPSQSWGGLNYQQEKIIAMAGCWDRSLTTPRLGFYSVSETTQTSKSYLWQTQGPQPVRAADSVRCIDYAALCSDQWSTPAYRIRAIPSLRRWRPLRHERPWSSPRCASSLDSRKISCWEKMISLGSPNRTTSTDFNPGFLVRHGPVDWWVPTTASWWNFTYIFLKPSPIAEIGGIDHSPAVSDSV